MSKRKVWLGNTSHAQWVPCPTPGFTKHKERFAASIKYENGGGDEVSTYAYQTTYDIDFPVGPVGDYEGIEAIGRFASGEWGTDYIRFVDPMYGNLNLFSARYAAPGLIERGFENWGASTPVYSDVSANSYTKPLRKATWTLTSSANAQSGDAFTFLVPANYYLHLGASGSATGTAQLVQHANGSSASALSLAADASGIAFTTTIAGGSTGNYVRVYQRRTSTAASTLTLIGLYGAITDSSSAPSLPRHLPGEGHDGLVFAGEDPAPQEYQFERTKLVSMGGVRLVEVEPWRA